MVCYTPNMLSSRKRELTSYHPPAQDKDCTQPRVSLSSGLVSLIASVERLGAMLTGRWAQGMWNRAGSEKSATKAERTS